MSETLSEREPQTQPSVIAPASRLRVGVVLAAGRSERLNLVSGGGSKALVRAGGLPLVERAARFLLASGLERVLVVVGHDAGPVAAVVNRLAPGRARAVYAERWEAGNGASLSAAELQVAEEDLFVLLTADHVFGEGAMDELLATGEPAVLVDESPSVEAWAEGTRVQVVDGRVVALGKDLDDAHIDCGAFVLPPRIFDCQREAEARGDPSLSGAVTALAGSEAVRAIPVPDGSWWQDVDTAADLRAARIRLRRSLIRRSDGPVSRYLNRPISTRISMAVAPLRLAPDAVSVMASLLALLAAALLAAGRGLAGGILTQLASVVDGLDGETARLQVRARAAGAFLDGMLDRLGDTAILCGLGLWALEGSTDPRVVLGLTVAAVAGAMLSMASKDRIAALGLLPGPERALGFLLGGRDGRLLLVAVGAVLARPVLALVAVVVTSAISVGARTLAVWFADRHAD